MTESWHHSRDPSPWSAMLERLVDLSIKVGGLREHRDQTNHRLGHLERQQSALSQEITILKTSTPSAAGVARFLGGPTSAIDKPILKHTQRFLPSVLGWIAEKGVTLVIPYIIPGALSVWAIIHRYGELLGSWLMRGWLLLFG